MTTRSVVDHQRRIHALLASVPRRRTTVGVDRALGRVLAADVASPIELPVFRNSSMDGYAVAASAIATAPVTLPVRGTIAAGDAGAEPLAPGVAVKIMTGAPIPPGADCVVPIEHTDGGRDEVTVHIAREPGDFVREPGSDVARGARVLAAGTVLAPHHIAALAAVGVPSVEVREGARAAVITTGNELVAAGKPLGAGQIYDSNGIALAALLEANGSTVESVSHSGDDAAEFEELLRRCVRSADVVFTCGGVSMGDFEVVRQVLEPLGGEFGHVAVQPGGPQGTSVVDGVPVISLPGNPVSTVVSFEVFARPVLREIAGLPVRPPASAPLTTEVRSPAGRRQFLRGRRAEDGVRPLRGPGSHLIVSMAEADVLIDVPEDVTVLPAGSTVRVWVL
jgi:molybdopterin molybdotransferase